MRLNTWRIMLGKDLGKGTPGDVSKGHMCGRRGSHYTNSAGKDSFVVNIALNPSHKVLDVCWCGHLCGPFEVL